MPRTKIELRDRNGWLYSGDADFADHESGSFDWEVSFVVPTAEVAQYQRRLGDRVAIHIPPDRRVPVIIGGFAFENDETATPFGGQGRIQLSGTGPLPVA